MGRLPPVVPLLALLALLHAEPPPTEALRLNEEGIAHLTEHRARRAVAAFEAAQEMLPQSRVLRRNLAAGLAALAEELREASLAMDAVAALDRAVRLHPERLRYRVLRGRVRYEAKDAYAREDFEFVLDRDPDHLDALVNLGHIAYQARRLEETTELWRRALALRPSDADVSARLEKAERELEVERAFEELHAPRFLVRYSPTIERALAETVLTLCETAYDELTTRFQTYPGGRTVVTLYAPSEFRSATRAHAWVAGLSDGTIRLTVRPTDRAARLRPTIYHEYTHHLVRAIAPHTPEWLHEGLAQLSEGRNRAAAEARLRAAGELKASDLSERILAQGDPRRVSLLYDVALSFTHHLLELSGDRGIHDLLERFKQRPSGEDPFRTVFGRARDELFEEWRRKLQGR